MLDLNDFFYFVQVVDRGGFTAVEPDITNSQIDTEPSHPATGDQIWGSGSSIARHVGSP